MSVLAGNPHACVVWWRELERWINPNKVLRFDRVPPGWTIGRVGEVVRPIAERVKVNPQDEYRMIGVKWYGQGTFHRETVNSNTTSASHLYRVVAGALIYNRLFAWKVSFAVVPQEHNGFFVSGEFPQFQVEASRLLPEYLYLFCITDRFIQAVNAASIGSAAVSRNRFKEEEFLGFPIALPPLPVQRAIVRRWREAQAAIAQAKARADALEAAIGREILKRLGIQAAEADMLPKVFAVYWKDLERWSVDYLRRDLASGRQLAQVKYPLVALGDIAKVSYGLQKCPGNRPGAHARPYLAVANVQAGRLDLDKIKYIEVPDSEMEAFRLKAGDLLVCEGNSADLVGRPAIWNDEIPDCVHQNHILKVRMIGDAALPHYVLEYMHTSPARNYFRSRAKQTTNLASLNSNDLRGLPLPLPPLNVQRGIVEMVAQKRAEVARERQAAAKLSAEVVKEVEEMILGTRPVKGAIA
jgi:type I restriction enzyme S subunit